MALLLIALKFYKNETGVIYDEAIDFIPDKLTYSVTGEKVE